MRVAAVDDDVTLFKMRHKVIDHFVDGFPSFYHQHHTTGLLQRFNEFFDGVGAHHLCTFGFVVDEIVYFGYRPIENSHAKSVVIHVQHQILAHHGEADQSNITTLV